MTEPVSLYLSSDHLLGRPLSPRQLEAVRLYVNGGVPEIRRGLGITADAANDLLRRSMMKLGANHYTHLAVKVMARHGDIYGWFGVWPPQLERRQAS